MKILLASIAAASALSVAAAAEPPRTVMLDVQKMTCATCPLTVQQVLKRQPGVVEARAEMKTATARVSFDPAKNTPELLARAVTEAGYPATVRP
jgi:mercuric ion binding protein